MSRALRQPFLQIILVCLAGLALGYLLFASLLGRPKVGVIDIPYMEIDSSTAAEVGKVLNYVREDREIKAVVFKLNSPGGTVAASSDLFLNLVRLREAKPVVMVVPDWALSGGYFMAMGTNYIYTTPGSLLGNVGAILWLPGRWQPEERVVTSGPFKGIGGSERMYISLLEMIKNDFVQTVVSQRGDRLRLTAEELSEGRLYLGLEAVRLGLADELGVEADAIRKAASLAGLRNYQVVDINQEMKKRGFSFTFSEARPARFTSLAPQFPYVYYRFMEPQ